MKIIDDFVPQETFDKLYSHVIGPWFPWYLQNNSVSYKNDGNYQFTHALVKDNIRDDGEESKANFLFKDFYNNLGVKELIRSKINLLHKTKKIKEFPLHNDCGVNVEPYTTAVFYFNTNNGYTIFKDGTKIESVKNRLVQFDGFTPHAGSTHTSNEPFRIVLNINYR